jgi:uncharacterized membrane protein YhfC
MVSGMSLSGMLFQVIWALVVVIGMILYLRRKERITLKPILIGAAIFLLFSQVLEKLVHVYFLQLNTDTAAILKNTWVFAVYGALAAGIFEELGRYVGFRWWLNKRHGWNDGLSYGVGHGGLEMLLIGVIGGVQSLVLAFLYNSGVLQQTLGSQMPAETFDAMIQSLTGTPFHFFVLGAFERIPALLIQLALSIVVLHGVREGRFRYVVYAIGLHALVDLFPALYQTKILSIYMVEAILLLVGVGAFLYLRYAKKKYAVDWNRTPEA